MSKNFERQNRAFFVPEQKLPWARLFKKQAIFRTEPQKTVCNGDPTCFIDIHVPQFSVGRVPTCHYVLSNDCGLNPEWVKRISKVQFQLYQDTNSEDKLIFIRDVSRNGTYLNGELIGQNQTRIMKDKDVISVIDANVKVFTFKDLTPRKLINLPKEITDIYFESKKVGSGAFGDVFKVYDRKANPYAVKSMKTNSLASLSNQLVPNNEIEILSKIEHVCVIKTIDTIKSSWGTCLVLEFMHGGDLLSRIINHPNRRLPEDQCRCIFYQMTEAVNYLHNMGITHRDIKPDNILLDSHNEYPLVKLSDFGLSKCVVEGTFLKSIIGTPTYTAPEILQSGIIPYTSKVDIWSMGVTLFAMLSGTLPFAEEYGNIHNQILSGNYSFLAPCWREIAQSALRLIRRMLIVEPEERIDMKSIFGSSWLHSKHFGIEQAMKIMKSKGGKVTRIENSFEHFQINNEDEFAIPPPPPKRSRHDE